MRAFHAIAGLPRSGSTLLCNLLAQNPTFYASSTSPLPTLIDQVSAFLSDSSEIRSDMHANPAELHQRTKLVLRSIATSWYVGRGKDVCFDKSRAWVMHPELFWTLFPASKMLIMVRDLKEVYASILKQHAKNPILRTIPGPSANRGAQVFSGGGLIGGPLVGIMDLQRRQPPGALFVQYEALVSEPARVMAAIYEALGEEPFEHDFDNVISTATDLDALYLNKFPHDGSGKVEPRGSSWPEWVGPAVAQEIEQAHANYYQAFYPSDDENKVVSLEESLEVTG